MLLILLLLLVVGSSIWVFNDAIGRDWSTDKNPTNPLGWAFGTLALWIVVFPIYLARRGRFPAK